MPKKIKKKIAKRKVRFVEPEEDLDESVVPKNEEAGFDLKVFGDVIIPGVLKALKGVVGTVAGIGMGISGLGPKEVWNVLNAPFRDWWRLWQEKRVEVNEDRSGGEIFLRGILGIFTGTGSSVLNSTKEIFIGGFQAAGGVAYIAKKLKDLGLPDDVVKAALASGHPLGLFAGTASKGIDGLEAFCRKLQEQLKKYESLGEVRTKALGEIPNILESLQSGRYQEAIERGVKSAEVATGRDLSSVRRAASTAQQLYQSPERLLEHAEKIKTVILPQAKAIVQKLGIDPKQIEAVAGNIVFAKGVQAEKRLEAVKALIQENPNFGIIAQAKDYSDALKKLVAYKDSTLIENLAVVKLIGKPGQVLPPDELEKLKREAIQRLKQEVSGRIANSRILDHAARTEREFTELKDHKERIESEIVRPSSPPLRPSSSRPITADDRSPPSPRQPPSRPRRPH